MFLTLKKLGQVERERERQREKQRERGRPRETDENKERERRKLFSTLFSLSLSPSLSEIRPDVGIFVSPLRIRLLDSFPPSLLAFPELFYLRIFVYSQFYFYLFQFKNIYI